MFNPKTERIKELATKCPKRVKELGVILDGKMQIATIVAICNKPNSPPNPIVLSR